MTDACNRECHIATGQGYVLLHVHMLVTAPLYTNLTMVAQQGHIALQSQGWTEACLHAHSC